LNHTTIEWCKNPDVTQGYTANIITGCFGPTDTGRCPYCYAHRLANGRLKKLYLANKKCTVLNGRATDFNDPFWPRWWDGVLDEIAKTKQPRGFFLNNMSDWLAPWIPVAWSKEIADYVKFCRWHRFYLLTKHPEYLPLFSPYPDNAYVGVSVDTRARWDPAIAHLNNIEAKNAFISCEPLLEEPPADLDLSAIKFNWLILGSCTGSNKDLWPIKAKHPELTLMPWEKKWTLQPSIVWVAKLVNSADKAGVKVFLKNNLAPLLEETNNKICNDCEAGDPCFSCGATWKMRQEVPCE